MRHVNTSKRVFFLVYAGLFLTLAVIIAVSTVQYSSENDIWRCYGKLTEFSKGWTSEDGTEINMSKLGNEIQCGVSESATISNTLPDIEDDYTLACLAKNCIAKFYVDGNLIGNIGTEFNLRCGNSLGNAWAFIPLSSDYSGKEITVEVIPCYTDNSSAIESITVGNVHEILSDILRNRLIAIILSILIAIVGFIFIVFDLAFSRLINSKHIFLYFGMLSISFAIWSIMQSNVLQLVFNDTGTLRNFGYMMLPLIIIPIYLFIMDSFSEKRPFLSCAVCSLAAIDFVGCTILHYTGLCDFHQTLIYTCIILDVAISGIIYLSIINIKSKSLQNCNITAFFTVFMMLLVTVAADVYFYSAGFTDDSVTFTRLGMLVFITTIGILNINEISAFLKMGLKADTMGKLAFTDGLTKIGNKAAFLDRVSKLQRHMKMYSTIGVVQFDVNNLKPINDNLGHEAGDKLIADAASIINNAFSQIGSCYRIGGDEFTALITVDHAPVEYEKAIEVFLNSIEKYNSNEDKKFTMKIAYGVAFYSEDAPEPLSVVQEKADQRMYAKKRQMKTEAGEPLTREEK